MFGLLAAIFAAIVGFGAGAAGLTSNRPNTPVPVNTYSANLCYNPETNVKIYLKYPDNFVNLTDKRQTLNPEVFNKSTLGPDFLSKSNPDGTFNTDFNSCKPMMFTDASGNALTNRTYIRVRRNVRISSCKVDELAGPHNSDSSKNPPTTCDNLYGFGPGPSALDLRGSCAIDKYPDLRKVAEYKDDTGQIQEVFWVPYTHNARCQYDPNQPNCGPGTTAALKDFVYVVNKRDGFDPLNPTKCVVKWDAGSTDKNACSHYFDVYMAEDTYKKVSGQTPVPTGDPSFGTYDFYKQAIQNCHESNIFIPTFDSPTGDYPPKFIASPFLAKDFYVPAYNKIQPRNDFELKNYQYFILSTPSINPLKTSLLQFASSAGTALITTCQPGGKTTGQVAATSNPACYVPLGKIGFQKSTNDFAVFNVYSLPTTPQTFYFQDQAGKDLSLYQYTITDSQPPSIKTHAPALQLNALEFKAENAWTWATPACKPALYFYPTKETGLNVKLTLDGEITDSIPNYTDNGWNITAYPDGSLTTNNSPASPAGGQPITNNYLYYSALINGEKVPDAGWVVEKSNIKDQISKIMTQIGFNEKEIADFNNYWMPNLTEKPYYFVTILPEKLVNEKEKLDISVQPDTTIRVRFIFEGLDAPIKVSPPVVPSYSRNGFVVADWGGALVGKSCDQLSIK